MKYASGMMIMMIIAAAILSACATVPPTANPAGTPSGTPPADDAPSTPPIPTVGETPPAAPPEATATPPAPAPVNPSEGYTLTTREGKTCFDSDKGITSEVAGYITDSTGVKHEDLCNGRTLTEYYCTEYDQPNLVGTKSVLCDLCEDGRCVAVDKERFCTDTDKGVDYTTKGTVKDINNQTYIDSCDTANNLKEYYCDPYDYGKPRFYLCPNGCSDGACI